jgi:hypothetical protein
MNDAFHSISFAGLLAPLLDGTGSDTMRDVVSDAG